MGHDPDRRRQCKCGSEDTTLLEQKKVPGGLDWYRYECNDCGETWRT
ncbi:hypothetical protein [Halorussus pelagicus]|nr:hypothetical protein [Halorussus pelagicus]